MNMKRNIKRAGISLFEVLIAMLVAAIGVFGVILLIPFAWEAAERGIDRENAINAARNYLTDVQAYGYHSPISWYDEVVPPDNPDTANEQTRFAPNASNQLQPTILTLRGAGYETDGGIIAGFPYIIDPIGADAATGSYPQFPIDTDFSINGFLPQLNQVSFVGAFDPLTGLPNAGLNTELSRRIAWRDDDLVFKDPADELGPPRQAYFSVGSVADVKRQYDGRFAMISFVVPEDDTGHQYKIFTLVGRAGDRDTERVFEVDLPVNGGGLNRGFQGILLGGGDVTLTEAPESVPVLDERQIRNGDWIMLINYHRADGTGDPAVDVLHDDIQLNFYQVLSASDDTNLGNISDNDNTNDVYSVTLQGPDFDVFRDWDVAAPTGSQTTQTVTYAVLIPNVLSVYERSFRTENNSVWTNQ